MWVRNEATGTCEFVIEMPGPEKHDPVDYESKAAAPARSERRAKGRGKK